MDIYLTIKTLHIISSTILFGTGIGIAFFMFSSLFTDHLQEKLYAARNTIIADYIFTLPAVIVQPLSGAWLIWQSGYVWSEYWLIVTYSIYAIAGMCWLPVVWIQIQLKNIIAKSLKDGSPLPRRYHKLFKLWLILGMPAFSGLIYIFYLMVTKPI